MRERQRRTSSTHSYSRAIESTEDAFRSAGSTSQVYVSISRCDVRPRTRSIHVPQVVLRGSERAVALLEDRDVEVHAPLLAAAVAASASGRSGHDCSDRLVALGSPGAGRSGRRSASSSRLAQRPGGLSAALTAAPCRWRISAASSAASACLGLLVGDRRVAGVEAHRHVLPVQPLRPPLGARSSTSASAPSASGSIASAIRVPRSSSCDAQHVRGCRILRAPSSSTTLAYESGLVEIVPSTPSGRSVDKDLCQPQRVRHPFLAAPVRAVDVGLHRLPVERPCGKPLMVNTYRPSASSQTRNSRAVTLQQLRALGTGQSQPDAERRVRRQPRLQRRRVRARLSCTASQLSPGWMFVQ